MSAYPAISLNSLVREIPVTARPDMRVPVRVYADDHLWQQIVKDRSLEQVVNGATLPGVTGCVYAMPDVHEGYSFPVGGVAAMQVDEGVISPGGVGYDINCGVRFLVSDLDLAAARPHLENVVHDLSRSIPSGPGRNPQLDFAAADLDRVLDEGCALLLERGLALPEDLPNTEAGGRLPAARSAGLHTRQHGYSLICACRQRRRHDPELWKHLSRGWPRDEPRRGQAHAARP